MTDDPLVSCIVPVFNGARFIDEALQSILRQSYQPIEVIAVDDGSTDGTAEVISTYGAQVRYARQENAGVAAARNRGLALARGTFIAFLDADDLWHEEKLTRQMREFDTRPELQICVAHLEHFWAPELEDEEQRLRREGHLLCTALPGYVCQTLLARRSVFSKVGEFDVSLRTVEDIDWFSRARNRRIKTVLLPETLVFRRMHRDNISRTTHVLDNNERLFTAIAAHLKRSRKP